MRNLFFLVLVFCLRNIYAQEESLIYNFYGLEKDALEKAFIHANIRSKNNLNDSIFLAEFYKQNEKEILQDYDIARFQQYMKQLSIVKDKRDQILKTSFTAISDVFTTCVTLNEKLKTMQKQRELEEKETLTAVKRKLLEQREKNSIEQKNIESESTYKIGQPIVNNTIQGSYEDLLTSDQNWNNQVRAWVQLYGVEKTREIVSQKRKDENLQSNEMNQAHGTQERIISAVTNNRQQIKVKLRNTLIIAYSTGVNEIGKQAWIPVLPSVSIQRTGVGTLFDNDFAKEFSHTASVNGMQIFFDF